MTSLHRFLWLELQIEALWAECFNDEQIIYALDNLPNGLDETYRRCLDRIEKHPQSREIAPRIFQCVSCSARPLRMAELREAIAINPGDRIWDPSKFVGPGVILPSCANLIVRDPWDDCVRFAHSSIKQYLSKPAVEKYLIEPISGELLCGELCVTYLSFSNISSALQVKDIQAPSPALMLQGMNANGSFLATMSTAFHKTMGLGSKNMKDKGKVTLNLSQEAILFGPPPNSNWYKFFEYSRYFWATQTKSISAKSPVFEAFRKIALHGHTLWDIYPWKSAGVSKASHIHALVHWSVRNKHIPMLQIAFDNYPRNGLADLCDKPYYDDGFSALGAASNSEFYEVIIMSTNFFAHTKNM